MINKIALEDTLTENTALKVITIGKLVSIIGKDEELLILAIGLTPDTDTVYFYKHTNGTAGNQLYLTKENVAMQLFDVLSSCFRQM